MRLMAIAGGGQPITPYGAPAPPQHRRDRIDPGRVGMDAHRLDTDRNIDAIHRCHRALFDRAERALGGSCRVVGLVLARDDEVAVPVVFQIGIELGPPGQAAPRVDGVVHGAGLSDQGHTEDLRGIGRGLGAMLVLRGHAEERAVRLDVVEGRAGRFQEALERADLIDQEIAQLLALHLHLAAPKTLAVGERRVRADFTPCASARRTVACMTDGSDA